MTVSSTATRVAYTGNGATTAFATTFPFFAASEIEVIERVIASGAETVKTLTTHYTVAGGNGATGTVTALVAPAASVQWVLRRVTAKTQEIDYTANDPFPAETHEQALDRLKMNVQELAEENARSLKFPKSDSAGLSGVIPSSVARANRYLAFDASGNATAAAGTVDATIHNALMVSLHGASSAAAARAVLDAPSNAEAILGALIDAKGDLIAGTAADTPARLAVGADGTALIADSSQATGLRWGAAGAAIVGALRNLRVSVAPSAKTCTWAVDEIIVETALGGTAYKGASRSFAFNGAGTGANGMDTGATPVSGDLHIYAIYNPGSNTWACLGTIAGAGANIYGGANMPSGYTASALIWSGKTDGAGNFVAFTQRDRRVWRAWGNVLAAGTATVFTSVSLAAVVPVNAVSVSGVIGVASNNTCGMEIAADANGIAKQVCLLTSGSATSFDGYYVAGNFNDLPIMTAQTFYYRGGTAVSHSIEINGYSF